MNKKRDLNVCPACEMVPCRCAGGGKEDEEKLKSDKNHKNNQGAANNLVNSVFILDSQLLYCTFFASTANQPISELLADLQEDNSSNAENTSFSSGMNMGGMDE